MKKGLSINSNEYNSIMLSACNAYRREGWLTEAVDLVAAGLAESETEVLFGMFSPFNDRLIKASDLGDCSEENSRWGFFGKFTEMVV